MNLVLILTVKKNRKKFKVNVDFRNEFFLKHYHMIMFIRIIIYYHFLYFTKHMLIVSNLNILYYFIIYK